ncbi:MAG: LacI family DNA-binding transcriptional regulator [Lysobacterales bacterium]
MATATIREVAMLAGVSIATVSRYMNAPGKVSEQTRNRVRDAIAQSGYVPNTLAQSFRRGRTNIVMVVLPSVGDPFFTEVIKGVRAAAEATGYAILINETQLNTLTADQVATMVVSKQTDGIILLASMSPFGTEVLSAQNQRLLPVVIGCEAVTPELTNYPSVHIDNKAAASDATKYLIGQGHKKIALICGPKTSLLTKDRESGFRRAMSAAGLSIEKGWVVNADLSLSGAVQATVDLLDHSVRPSAIFCATDEMAMGCMHAVRGAGLKIPQDISLMGFDDNRYAAMLNPPLTTIKQPAFEIGERVMYRLHQEIERDGDQEPESAPELLRHELVIRESVGPPVEVARR